MRLVAELIMLLCLLTGPVAVASELTIQLPPETRVRSAVAVATKLKLETKGQLDRDAVRFSNLLPDTAYDVRLDLADGTVLQGVDLSWYNDLEPPKSDAREVTDEDRTAITQIVTEVKSFYNRSEILRLSATHERATALVQRIRDSAFHNSKSDEVIWRMELWYFRNQYGGWEKVGQQDRVLRRERYASSAEYQKATGPLRWTGELGGIRLTSDETRTVTLAPEPAPAPQPPPAKGS